ncbi:hypothetical protein QR680_005075 [Steinernema hermaphroditum]|uniref:Haloacid dehalogenase-like hydrolase domain-containing protein 2 n=1 Tax=Steinernema hermaphroditum TaxID=289476 RepID=A0AA39LU85_9BILA|nr:hypothetical protein QR680_005075 [Steinernema hermaphroditum]
MARRIVLMIDLSGTLHVAKSQTPGAVEALKKLRASQRFSPKILFVTNTTKESINVLHNRLTSIGFDIQKNEIFTSLLAARRKIENENLRPMLMLEEEAMEDFAGIDVSNPNAVVVGLSPSQFHFERMNEAFRLLLAGAKFVAVHKGRYYKREDGLSLGPGPFVEALEYATDKKASVVGKPEIAFFHSALEFVGAMEAVMIGDDVRDDVCGAINAGFKAILVRTGKYRPDDELLIPESERHCVDNFAEAVELLESGKLFN